jgi:hypothetical protein
MAMIIGRVLASERPDERISFFSGLTAARADARNVKIARSAVCSWRKDDQDFDAAWRDAVETGLDVLETRLYDRTATAATHNLYSRLQHPRSSRGEIQFLFEHHVTRATQAA